MLSTKSGLSLKAVQHLGGLQIVIILDLVFLLILVVQILFLVLE